MATTKDTKTTPKTHKTPETAAIMAALDDIRRNSLITARQLLTVDDVSVLTGMTKQYLRLLCHQREIPHYKPRGRLVYFDKDEITAWLKRNRIEMNEEAEENAAIYDYLNR